MKKTVKTGAVLVRRINGLSVGDRARCGEYGVVRCSKAAGEKGTRMFAVSGSKVLRNGAWTMAGLRKAICG